MFGNEKGRKATSSENETINRWWEIHKEKLVTAQVENMRPFKIESESEEEFRSETEISLYIIFAKAYLEFVDDELSETHSLYKLFNKQYKEEEFLNKCDD